jgi:RHS repeat-associated protein
VGLTTKSFSYNAIGNIVTKSDVGTYNYPLPGAARQHAVSSITGTVNGFVNPSFTYDADGNMLTGVGRTLTYTSFDMPLTVAGVRFAGGASYNYTYTYNEHERTRLVHSTLGTFIYVHPAGRGELLYEKEVKPTGVVEHKNYINAGGLLIGVIIKRSDGTGDTNYFHQDRLGSLTLITNSAGGVLEHLAYDAFGKRRNPNGTDSTNNSLFGINTDRGFTGHERLDEVALIHMNGRIYDPVTARFLTPDPNVQSPTQLQSYNRYSYVFNNPLAYTDPTGYLGNFIKNLFHDPVGTIVHTVEKVVTAALDNPIRTIATIAVAYYTGYYADFFGAPALVSSAAGGFAGGLVGSGGDFKAALIGGITAGAFNWAGGTFADSPLQLVAAHATIGCASAVASGGSCGAGALSAGFSKVATLGLNDYTTWDALSKGIAVTVIGGTASVLAGGKFENGAATAAYGYLFNQLMSKNGRGPND